MKTEKVDRVLLESRSPFSSTIVGDGWDKVIDVDEINLKPTRLILRAIREVHQQPSQMVLVQGEPGIGKTHIVVRLRKKAREKNYLFVQIHPPSDLSTIFTHIFRELFVSLRKKSKTAEYSPLDELVGQVISRTLLEIFSKKDEKLPKWLEGAEDDEMQIYERLKSLQGKEATLLENLTTLATNYLSENYPELEIQLVRVLLLLLAKPDLRILALEWLQGNDLAESSLEILGVTSSINNDDMAVRVLNTIITLLKDKPVLMVFDQLESVSDRFREEEGIRVLFDVLVRMHDHTNNIAILLLSQAHAWSGEISKIIQKSALDRIDKMTFLSTLSEEEVIELVEARLTSLWAENRVVPPFPTYPFGKDFLISIAEQRGWNPRSILKALSAVLEDMILESQISIPTISPSPITEISVSGERESEITWDKISIYLTKKMKELETYFNSNPDSFPYPFLQDSVKGALLDIIKGSASENITLGDERILFQGVEVGAGIAGRKEIDIISEYTSREQQNKIVGFEINNSQNSISIFYSLQRLTKALDQPRIDIAFLLRDERLPTNLGPRSTELAKKINESGGKITYLTEKDTVLFVTSKSLLDMASAGDLNVEDYLVPRREVIKYVLEFIVPKLSSLAKICSKLDL